MRVNKYKFKTLTVILALFFLSTSCVEEYWPDLKSGSDQLLVIDGKITNFPGPYTVKLSTSSSINDAFQIPLSSAKVIIIDNQGNQEYLTEKNPGIYETKAEGIRGIIGRSYKVKVQLNSGKIYESELEEMKIPVEVENISVEESLKVAKNALETDQQGYQFYVTSKLANTSVSYFFWDIEETYEYMSDYKIVYMYDGHKYDSTRFNPLGFARPMNVDTLRYCWQTQSVGQRFSYSTEYLSQPVINNLPLHFIPFADERLRIGYSIMVSQYTISEAAYTFMDKLDKQNNSQDALFTTQPFQIRGNVFNIEDASEPVLGYFMVASGSNGPRLLTRAPARIRYNNTLCPADTSMPTIMWAINNTSTNELPIYFTEIFYEDPENPMAEAVEFVAFVRQDCLDCQTKGGVALKPEYWNWEK